MLLKSVFQNKIIINILFFVFVFLSAISFLRAFLVHNDDFTIPLLGQMNAPLRVNVEISHENIKNFHFFANGYEISPQYLYKENTYVLYETKKDTDYLYFKADENTLNSIDNIIINLNKNFYCYSKDDIKKFVKTGNNGYILPFDIKYTKSSKYINDKGIMHRFAVYILSIFYNSNFYVFPLICLFLAVLIYQTNKEKINLGFNLFKKSAILWIILIGFILRVQDNSFPFWGDELYTAAVAGGIHQPLIKVFQDPGNPPLFFILAKLWMLMFGVGESACRLLTAIFSTISIYAVYIFVKRNLNINAALLASLLFAVNVYSIQTAQEFRCYSLCALFAVLSGFYLFETIKEKKNKDIVIYGILAALMANTHYFQIFILLGNFILAMLFLDNKTRLKFFIANLIAAISFLPYFIMTGLNQGLLDKDFNNLPFYGFSITLLIILVIFSNKIIPILSSAVAFCLAVPKTRNLTVKNDNSSINLYLYSFYTICVLFFLSYLFSLLIRPIVRSYYFTMIIPYVSILIACVFFIPFKNKILKAGILLIFIYNAVFCFTGRGVYINKDDVLVIRAEETCKYAYYNSSKYINENKKIAIAIFDFASEYMNLYKRYKEYGKKEIQVIPYRFAPFDTYETFNQKIIDSKADVIYIMLHFAKAAEFIEEFNGRYKISSIITDKGVISARMIKR